LREGVELDDGVTAPAQVSRVSEGVLRIVIHEGRNRQVRRMCSAIGHEVVRLVRTRIGPIQDPTLPPGASRTLSVAEVRKIMEAVGVGPTEDSTIRP
jgi:23S rRNA pseudouridine2605 synthase